MCMKKTASNEVIVAPIKEVEQLLKLFKKRAEKLADPYGKITYNPNNPLDQGMIGTIRYLRKAKRAGLRIFI